MSKVASRQSGDFDPEPTRCQTMDCWIVGESRGDWHVGLAGFQGLG
jgi:hypothetical protein